MHEQRPVSDDVENEVNLSRNNNERTVANRFTKVKNARFTRLFARDRFRRRVEFVRRLRGDTRVRTIKRNRKIWSADETDGVILYIHCFCRADGRHRRRFRDVVGRELWRGRRVAVVRLFPRSRQRKQQTTTAARDSDAQTGAPAGRWVPVRVRGRQRAAARRDDSAGR